MSVLIALLITCAQLIHSIYLDLLFGAAVKCRYCIDEEHNTVFTALYCRSIVNANQAQGVCGYRS